MSRVVPSEVTRRLKESFTHVTATILVTSATNRSAGGRKAEPSTNASEQPLR